MEISKEAALNIACRENYKNRRIRTKFLILPRYIRGEFHWLRRIGVIEQVHCDSWQVDYFWKEIGFDTKDSVHLAPIAQ